MAGIALLILATRPEYRKVRFVFSNRLLMMKDQDDFEDLWKLLSMT